jgi:hypothetical protein
MVDAHPLPVRTAPRPSRRPLAVAALALICGWTVYTIPSARARAEAALRPLAGALWPAGPDIGFADLRAERGEWNGQTVLYVEGAVVNASGRRIPAPPLRVALIGDDGRPIYAWTAKPAKAELETAGQTSFRTRLLAPPETFQRIEITAAGG